MLLLLSASALPPSEVENVIHTLDEEVDSVLSLERRRHDKHHLKRKEMGREIAHSVDKEDHMQAMVDDIVHGLSALNEQLLERRQGRKKSYLKRPLLLGHHDSSLLRSMGSVEGASFERRANKVISITPYGHKLVLKVPQNTDAKALEERLMANLKPPAYCCRIKGSDFGVSSLKPMAAPEEGQPPCSQLNLRGAVYESVNGGEGVELPYKDKSGKKLLDKEACKAQLVCYDKDGGKCKFHRRERPSFGPIPPEEPDPDPGECHLHMCTAPKVRAYSSINSKQCGKLQTDCTDELCCKDQDAGTCDVWLKDHSCSDTAKMGDTRKVCQTHECNDDDCCVVKGKCDTDFDCGNDGVRNSMEFCPDAPTSCNFGWCCSKKGYCQDVGKDFCDGQFLKAVDAEGQPIPCTGDLASCSTSTCCEAVKYCDEISCSSDVEYNIGRIACTDNECDAGECCAPKATCAAFLLDTTCPDETPLPKAAPETIMCDGEVAQCNSDLCCEAKGKCDDFTSCGDEVLRAGKVCEGKECTKPECCEKAGQCADFLQSTPCPNEKTPKLLPAECTSSEPCTEDMCCEVKATCEKKNPSCEELPGDLMSKGDISSIICPGLASDCGDSLCCEPKGTCEAWRAGGGACEGDMVDDLKKTDCGGNLESCSESTCCAPKGVCGDLIKPTPCEAKYDSPEWIPEASDKKCEEAVCKHSECCKKEERCPPGQAGIPPNCESGYTGPSGSPCKDQGSELRAALQYFKAWTVCSERDFSYRTMNSKYQSRESTNANRQPSSEYKRFFTHRFPGTLIDSDFGSWQAKNRCYGHPGACVGVCGGSSSDLKKVDEITKLEDGSTLPLCTPAEMGTPEDPTAGSCPLEDRAVLPRHDSKCEMECLFASAEAIRLATDAIKRTNEQREKVYEDHIVNTKTGAKNPKFFNLKKSSSESLISDLWTNFNQAKLPSLDIWPEETNDPSSNGKGKTDKGKPVPYLDDLFVNTIVVAYDANPNPSLEGKPSLPILPIAKKELTSTDELKSTKSKK
jgi:hypothetical protein